MASALALRSLFADPIDPHVIVARLLSVVLGIKFPGTG